MLWVPKVGSPSSLIKVSFDNKTPNGADASLDVDARSGYGPETITINSLHPGIYCYAVSRYSSSPTNYSGAKVKLYLSDGTSQEFRVEDATGSTNKANWTVFKIDTTAGQLDVKTVNVTTTGGACN